MLRQLLVTLCALVLLGLPAGRAAAGSDPLPAPSGRVILDVTGAIEVRNAEGAARFDRDMLRAIAWRRITSYTPWTDGEQSFSGVPLTALLERVGARGEVIEAKALNDYKATLPVSDAARYEVLLALEHNGAPMPVRTKGPIWIIYPMHRPQDVEIGDNNEKMVWQLRELAVR